MELYFYSPLRLRGVNKDNFNIDLFLKVLPIVTFHLLLIKCKHFKISKCVSSLSFQILHYKLSEVFYVPFRKLLHFIDYQVSSSL
jgi:hypothetical protein